MFNKNLMPAIRFYCRRSFFMLFFACLLLPANLLADEKPNITIKTATLTQQDSTFLLNSLIVYNLSDEAIEALHNGVTLTFNIDLSITEPRKWLWNKHHTNLTLPYQLRYHTLAKIYQVSDTTNNIRLNFSSLSAALHSLGTLTDIPIYTLTNSPHINANASLNAYLNIEALPLPMRPLAYITPGWHLRSNTFQWPLAQ
ncbi:DUF4390 domain-containing protein [Cycloclasticus pugetii]|jgi:hypothetical protein|uniref:DUF4390 domain-containing protein n=1 Tax=Cycloclasticus pugetii TaxID=34068 RepID=UPI002409268B|nr:DUF4390 domain-containing protein [Cycloclasticus pugetii]MDF1829188.1 DUF4390 domain-containing protein [Cycloclasticus pugetii]